MIYLDNAATTRLSEPVLDAMLPYLRDGFGNPDSPHKLGVDASKAVEKAREQIASLIGCDDPKKIIFTSSGSEANTMAIMSAMRAGKAGFEDVVISSYEHSSVSKSAEALSDSHGLIIRKIPVNKHTGTIDEGFLSDVLDIRTALVSVMHVNNELGTINDIERLSKLCNDFCVPFHTDCVQSAGHIQINVKNFNPALLSMSAHKMNGPKGVGALYIRDPMMLSPIIYGGVQERNLRGGTLNVPAIVGFGAAAEIASQNMARNMTNNICLHKLCVDLLRTAIEGTRLHFACIKNAPSRIVSVAFDGIDAETLIGVLSQRGVFVSSSSACDGKNVSGSKSAIAAGISPDEASRTIRISFSNDTTEADVIEAVNIIADAVSDLRSMIP